MNANAILAAKSDGRQVFTIDPDAALQDAARLLDSHRVGALVVQAADGQVRGILSERDIVRVIAREGAEVLSQPVSAVMTADVITAAGGDSIDRLMGMMTQRRIRHLPIVDGTRRMIGLVSIGDVVKAKIELAETETAAMKAYIASV